MGYLEVRVSIIIAFSLLESISIPMPSSFFYYFSRLFEKVLLNLELPYLFLQSVSFFLKRVTFTSQIILLLRGRLLRFFWDSLSLRC